LQHSVPADSGWAAINSSSMRTRGAFEDAAVALIDEAELPRPIQRRFTIGY
jgi:hypothetical protein